jgi:eukaryotic translation initiation factor 2-alpha kinase 4
MFVAYCSAAISPANIGLIDSFSASKTVKLVRPAFYAKLHDMHKSEPFENHLEGDPFDETLPDDWLFSDAIDSPLTYTRCRDIHATGVLVLQMFMGIDVPDRFLSPELALAECGLPLFFI